MLLNCNPLKDRTAASDRRADALLDLTLQVRAVLGIDDDQTVVSVSGPDCGKRGCGGTRTVVLVMRPNQPTELVTIEKPPEEVMPADLAAALLPAAGRSTCPAACPPSA